MRKPVKPKEMLVLIELYTDQSVAPGAYMLAPTSKKTRDRLRRAGNPASTMFASDWEWPGLARELGWRGRRGNSGDEIARAVTWLDAHDGHVFRLVDSPYFGVED